MSTLQDQIDWLFDHCKIVCFTSDEDGGYPLEHHNAANKYMRDRIEAKMNADLSMPSPEEIQGATARYRDHHDSIGRG